MSEGVTSNEAKYVKKIQELVDLVCKLFIILHLILTVITIMNVKSHKKCVD